MKLRINQVRKYVLLLLSAMMLLFPWEIQAAECSDAVTVVKSYYQSLAKRKVNAALAQWETTTKRLKSKLSATKIVKLNRVKLSSCDVDTGEARVFVDVTAVVSCGRGKWRGTFFLNDVDDE
ncbi:MAG: hypothetical protein R3E08_09755, partial [Thiotrichaceae bacterium]